MGTFFARLFGGNDNNERVRQEQPPAPKGPSRVSEQDRAVLVCRTQTFSPFYSFIKINDFLQQLKKQRDDLHKYQKRVSIKNYTTITI